MKTISLCTVFFCTIICIGGIWQANATTVINNSYSGWYDDDGFHQFTNTNYGSGNNLGHQVNNFFVFDLSGVSGNVSGATFNVYSYLFSITVSGTYTIYETSLTPSIETDHTGDIAIYNGLTSGSAIGSITVSPLDSYSILSLPLNGTGLTWLYTNQGSQIVLGGSFPLPLNTGSEDGIFLASGYLAGNNLTINPIPEPTTMLLLGSGLIGLAGYGRKKFFKK